MAFGLLAIFIIFFIIGRIGLLRIIAFGLICLTIAWIVGTIMS